MKMLKEESRAKRWLIRGKENQRTVKIRDQ
jgi:hypothetical protein